MRYGAIGNAFAMGSEETNEMLFIVLVLFHFLFGSEENSNSQPIKQICNFIYWQRSPFKFNDSCWARFNDLKISIILFVLLLNEARRRQQKQTKTQHSTASVWALGVRCSDIWWRWCISCECTAVDVGNYCEIDTHTQNKSLEDLLE